MREARGVSEGEEEPKSAGMVALSLLVVDTTFGTATSITFMACRPTGEEQKREEREIGKRGVGILLRLTRGSHCISFLFVDCSSWAFLAKTNRSNWKTRSVYLGTLQLQINRAVSMKV
uniref:Uncharacterized protein n=1 Tax=Oryza barthii TaxID=65489 RepID=A0A0D3G9Y7_9ORYZ